MIAIDTNVLLRYLLVDDVTQHKRATKLITSGEQLLLSDVVIVEAIWTLRGKRYSFNKKQICHVIRSLVSDSSMVFEDTQVIWSSLKDYESAKPVKGKHLDFADALILNKAKYVASIKNVPFHGFYSFDSAVRLLPGTMAPT